MMPTSLRGIHKDEVLTMPRRHVVIVTPSPSPRLPGVPTSQRSTTTFGSLVVTALALLMWRPVNNDDTFMYLATGKWVIDNQRIPHVDPFSWTFDGHPWQSTGWGWGIVLATFDRVAGVAGVAATKPLLVACIAVGVIWTGRVLGGSRSMAPWACLVAALVAMSPWITDRAQMASYAFFPFALGLAAKATAGRRLHPGWLAGLVVLQIAWINVHSAGLISAPFLAAFLAGRTLDTFRASQHRGVAALTRAALWPGITLVLAALALLVNPWGWGMITHAADTRDLSRATISEWAPLLRAGPTAIIPIIVTLAGIGGFWIGRRHVRWELLLPCVLGAVMTFDAVRNTPFLLLAFAVFVPPSLPRVRGPLAGRVDLARVGVTAVMVIAVVFAASTVPSTGRPGPGIPIRATAALPAGCQLRNLSGMGGYVMATRPDVPVSADGRNDLYGLPGYDQNAWFTGTRSEAEAGISAIEREHTDCVLARNENTIVPLLRARGWEVAGHDPSGISLVPPSESD